MESTRDMVSTQTEMGTPISAATARRPGAILSYPLQLFTMHSRQISTQPETWHFTYFLEGLELTMDTGLASIEAERYSLQVRARPHGDRQLTLTHRRPMHLSSSLAP